MAVSGETNNVTFWMCNINEKVKNNEYLVKGEKTSDNDIKMVVDEEEFICPICYGDFEFNRVVYIPDCKCKLMFHRGCIKDSMGIKGDKECPQCRSKILGLYQYASEDYNKKYHLKIFNQVQSSNFSKDKILLPVINSKPLNIGLPIIVKDDVLSIDSYQGCTNEIEQIQNGDDKFYQNALFCYKLILDKIKNEYQQYILLNEQNEFNSLCWGVKKNSQQCSNYAKFKVTYTFPNGKEMTVRSCGVHCKKRKDGFCHTHFVTCEEVLFAKETDTKKQNKLKEICLPTE